ncbi:MAG: 30S ribosomal protein S21 [Gemmataceae bacterium]
MSIRVRVVPGEPIQKALRRLRRLAGDRLPRRYDHWYRRFKLKSYYVKPSKIRQFKRYVRLARARAKRR